MMRRIFAIVVSSLVLVAAPASAEVRLPAFFSDGMVLQQGRGVPVWGFADPGEEVSVTLSGQTRTVKADSEGRWMMRLDQLASGGPLEMTVAGKNTITVRNILVGEVWVASGQSNMEWPVSKAANAQIEVAVADFPQIRMFTVKRAVADGPRLDVTGAWKKCSPETVGDFSAVGYFFARELHRKIGVPIGVIHTSWGGTPAEAWTSRAAMEADPELRVILQRSDEEVAEYLRFKDMYDAMVNAWRIEANKADAEGRPRPKRPKMPVGPHSRKHPANLFNAMVAPLIPYGIKGVIWYQGEQNVREPDLYRRLFPALIRDWRARWGQGDFPFLFVQLPNYLPRRLDKAGPERPAEPSDGQWARLREAQFGALALPNTAMVVAIDIGDPVDLHPKNKQDVGHRLVLAAEAVAYVRPVVYSGPIFNAMRVEGRKAILNFRHVGGGLEAKGGELIGFYVAGSERRFVRADARIVGDRVEVWGPEVDSPIAVRYCWADNPACSLYNREGLPASPFRTDDWPIPPPQKRATLPEQP